MTVRFRVRLGLWFSPDPIRAFAFRFDRAAFGRCANTGCVERPWGTTPYGEMLQRAGVRGQGVIRIAERRELVQRIVQGRGKDDIGISLGHGVMRWG